MRLLAGTVLALLGSAIGAPSPKLRTFEQFGTPPAEWRETGPPDADSILKFTISLTAAEPGLVEKKLYEISTPGSEHYGKHLNHHDLRRLIAPHAEGKESVLEWLKQMGISPEADHGNRLEISTSVKNANALFGADFKKYEYISDVKEQRIRTLKVELPENLHGRIDMIHPTTYFGRPHGLRSTIHSIEDVEGDERVYSAAPCGSTVTPACIIELYNMTGVTVDPSKAGILGVAGFLEQIARFGDLNSFLRQYQPTMAAANANFTYTILNDGSMSQTSLASASEANLDIQYTLGLVHPLKTHFYSVGKTGVLIPDLDQPDASKSQNEPFDVLFNYLLTLEDKTQLPHTISISYGDNEQSVPPTFARTVCNQVAQLGTLGVSVIAGSGDDGPGSSCQTNDGRKAARFMPMFPTACPFVTSVGGTYGSGPERAVSFSGGGFSDIWAQPEYQASAVAGFFSSYKGPDFSAYYNASGRAFPDIAALAQGFRIVNSGRTMSIGGTSAATPVVASVVALLNAARLQSGKPTLGFLNPWIYSSGAKMLTDIVDGSSSGCKGRSAHTGLPATSIPGAAWPAVKGWDPVTGLGTPNMGAMLANLPA